MKFGIAAMTLCLAFGAGAVRADDTTAPSATEGSGTTTTTTKTKTKKKHTTDATTSTTASKSASTTVTKDDGLVIEDVKVGSGTEAKEGSRVKVHYKGTFVNGKVFDSNSTETIDKIQPFTLDKGHLIAGWVEGIPGMKVGGLRKLKVPFKLAYGENGTPDGTIPPRADLNFEVELLKVE
jgi:FKBP-type peptidyl-prolyl cis-trans isomerase